MRLVLDTNVVIAAVVGSGAPARLIELATEGEIDLFTSAPLLAELAKVLDCEHIARRFEQRGRKAAEVLSHYEALAERVVPASISRTAPDPDDDQVLACALAAQADAVVSGDKRLRNLKTFQRIPIVSTAEALAISKRRGSRNGA